MQIFFYSLILFLLGLAAMIYGYRIFLVLLPVWGFFLGLWLGADITAQIIGSGFLGTVSGWVVGLGLGLIFSVLSYLFWGVAVAIQAAIIGYSIGHGLVGALLGPGLVSVLIGAVLGILILVLALTFNLQKYVAVTVTSLIGSNAVLTSILLIFNRVSLQQVQSSGTSIIPIARDSWLWMLLWLVMAIASIAGQLRANRSYEFKPETYMEGWG